MADESSTGEVSGGQDAPTTEDVDKVVEMKDYVCVGPFQTEILKGRAARAPTHHSVTHLYSALGGTLSSYQVSLYNSQCMLRPILN